MLSEPLLFSEWDTSRMAETTQRLGAKDESVPRANEVVDCRQPPSLNSASCSSVSTEMTIAYERPR